MILGIGNDIVEIERIRIVLQRYQERFLNRIFTLSEQEYCLKRKDPAIHFAGLFAAKEAAVKSLGTGFSLGISWIDIEIGHDQRGKPILKFSPFVIGLCGDQDTHLSISHCRQFATAFAISLKKSSQAISSD